MKNILKIYPTFLCPFACNFCLNRDKILLNQYLDINDLEKFLKNNSKKFDKVIVSGGEPMNFPKVYFNLLVETIKNYISDIQIDCYPFQLLNYRDDVEYNFSYDFLARPRALEAWENMLRFPKKFDITITLVPLIFKYHPNAIIQKLSYLKNLKNVELKPYFKNASTTWQLNDVHCEKFLKAWLGSKINTSFNNVNKEKMRYLNNKPSRIEFEDETIYNILPDGSLNIDYFDEQNIHSFKPILDEDIGKIFSNNPSDTDFYNDKLIKWCEENRI